MAEDRYPAGFAGQPTAEQGFAGQPGMETQAPAQPAPPPPPQEEDPEATLSAELKRLLEMTNIAEEIDDDTLRLIGDRVVNDFDIDKKSRAEWEDETQKWMKLAKLTTTRKSFPWDGAADIKYPIIAQSAIQFAARAYPAIINDKHIVKGRVIGEDPDGSKADRVERVSEHMNYQLTEEMVDWEDGMDQLLTHLSITGLAYRKTYRDKIENVNVSEFLTAEEVVVHMYAPSLERANRITQEFDLYRNEIEENVRAGAFLKLDYGEEPSTEKHKNDDKDRPVVFLEQHRWWDLDEDGYEEPYIITVHKDSKKVARIVARYDQDGVIGGESGEIIKIIPTHYFTKFSFLPSFDKSYYPIGFGQLLGPGNETINSSINQLLDAGTLNNTGGGFIDSRLGLKGGAVTIQPGEYKVVNAVGDDLRKMIVPKPVTNPSGVTYSLLDLIIGSQEKLASVSELMMGQQPVANVPATTSMATIEQALKVFTAIYKRVHRALTSEFRKIKRLNRIYLSDQDYFTVTDNQKSIARADYDDTDCDIVPASDPNDVTDTMRLLTAQALLELRGTGLNEDEIKVRYLEALHIPETEKLLQVQQPEPDPSVELEKEKLEIERMKVDILAEKAVYEILEKKANVILKLAEAEAKEAGPQIDVYKAQLQALEREEASMRSMKNAETSGANRVGGGGKGSAGGVGNTAPNQAVSQGA